MIEHSLRRARAGQIHSTGMLTVRPSRAAPSTAAVSLGALLLTASLLGLGTLQRRAPRMTCEKDLSQARIQGLFAWKSAAPWQPGVSYSEAISMLQQLVTDDFTYTVTGGMGHYQGINEAAQYIFLTKPAYNKEWLHLTFSLGEHLNITAAGNRLEVTDDVFFRFFRDEYVVPFLNGTEKYTFEPCGTRIQSVVRNPPAGTLQAFAWTAGHTKYQGTYDLCMVHEAFCTGIYRQYDSFTQCEEYISSLPTVSKVCGDFAPLAGLSKTCKFKHKFLVPYVADYCNHIGPSNLPNGAPNYDADGELTCSDEAECPLWQDSPAIHVGQPSEEFKAAARHYELWFEESVPNSNGSFALDDYVRLAVSGSANGSFSSSSKWVADSHRLY